MTRVFAALFVLALAGCAAGNRFDFNQARQVQIGTTEAELTERLGQPYAIRGSGSTRTFVWLYSHGVSAKTGSVAFRVRDRKVVDLPDISEFD